MHSVWNQCALCQSIKHIPEEIHEFEPNIIPEHPGKTFTVDVIKHAKKNILVAVENFSGFISTCFIATETSKDLVEGIIKAIFPIKSALSVVRVDQAPGFRKLIKDKISIADLGLELTPGDAKNKNALAIVDKKISELEKEIKKIAPSQNIITVKILALATNTVNEKIRNQGMSAKEILFSRDQITSENLHLQDADIADITMRKRKENIKYSSKSKSSTGKLATSSNAKKGQVVFLKHDGSKFQRRDLYLVTDVDLSKNTVTICKIVNALSDNIASFQPQNYLYNVKQTDVFLAPCQPTILQPEIVSSQSSEIPFSQNSTQHSFADESQSGHSVENVSPSAHTSDTDDKDIDIWFFEEIPINCEIPENDHISTESGTPLDVTIADIQTVERDDNLSAFPILDDLFNKLLPNPTSLPQPGNQIEFLDTNSQPPTIAKALIMPKRLAVQKRWPQCFLIKCDNYQHPFTLNLQNTRWRYATPIQQIDGDLSVEDIREWSQGNCNDDPLLTTTDRGEEDSGDRYSNGNDWFSPQSFFIDDELADQESVFGYNYLENLTTSFSNSLGLQDIHTLPSTPEPVRRLIDTLDLAIPTDGRIIPNRVYHLPPFHQHLHPLRSHSDSNLSPMAFTPPPCSTWRSRWFKFKRFWSRFTLGDK